MSKNKSQSFVEGAFVMMFASIVVKIIGALFKIPIMNLIDVEGSGIFTVAYNIYTFMFILSTAGLPVAVSKMVAEANALGRQREVKKIARVTLTTFVIIGIFCSLVMIIFANQLALMMSSSASVYAIMAIAPAIFFTCIVSAIRGYFQGLSNMVPTAVSQVIEALGKLVFGLALAYYLSGQGYSIDIVVAGAIGGVTLGTLISAAYVILVRLRDINHQQQVADSGGYETQPWSRILKSLIKLTIPITIGASVLGLTNIIDMGVVMSRLQEGCFMTEPEATSLYGIYSMAQTLFGIPPALMSGFGASIIPAIAGALALNNREKSARHIETAFRMMALITLPCAFGMAAIAGPTLRMLYYNIERVGEATPLLMLLCPAMFLVSAVTITNAILQAMGRERAPIKSMAVGGAVKLVTNYVLVGIPAINIHGAPIGTIICYGTITVLNIVMIRRAGVNFSLSKAIVKPFASSAIMGVFAWLIYSPLHAMAGALVASSKIAMALAVTATVGLAAVLYVLLLVATKALPREDVLMLPKGEKIAKLLRIK